MEYDTAKARRDALESAVKAAGEAMRQFPTSGPMGLTPDHVRESAAFQTAKRTYDSAFAKLRAFNGWYVKAFAKEIRAERRAR